jgi:hypothetical protein
MKPIIRIKLGDISNALCAIDQVRASSLGLTPSIFPPKKRKSVKSAPRIERIKR